MAVFRIEKNRSYTVMSNYHLRDKTISLKAKGLLSLMLSLPEDWDYTLRGLASISMEGVAAIRSAVCELEAAGYLERRRERIGGGRLGGCEYIIREEPLTADEENVEKTVDNSRSKKSAPMSEKPMCEKHTQEKPISENPAQINTKESNTELIITEKNKYGSIDRRSGNDLFSDIQNNLSLDELREEFGSEAVGEVTEVMADIMTSRRKSYIIGGRCIPAKWVRNRCKLINDDKLRYLLRGYDAAGDEVRNRRAYLTAAVYNSLVRG